VTEHPDGPLLSDQPVEQDDERHVRVGDLGEGFVEPSDRPELQHDDEQVPADVAVREPDSADPRVAAAVARLDELGDNPPADHVEVYEDVHRVLQDALADAARPQEAAEQGQPGGPQQ
jgi:hypothetical protein